MSGGEFEYFQDRIDEAAKKVAELIRDTTAYQPEAIARFRECELTMRRAAAMLRRVDWLVSCDDSERTFHERWENEVPTC